LLIKKNNVKKILKKQINKVKIFKNKGKNNDIENGKINQLKILPIKIEQILKINGPIAITIKFSFKIIELLLTTIIIKLKINRKE
jgi:hypothetical protein